jgi:GGDEF domain-containing protein
VRQRRARGRLPGAHRRRRFRARRAGAGGAGAARIVAALAAAVGQAFMPEGIAPVQASFAYALAPDDGSDPATLFGCADARLLSLKRAGGTRRAAASGV